MKTNIEQWAKAAAVRAVKTAAQAAIGAIGASACMGEVDWLLCGSAALLGGHPVAAHERGGHPRGGRRRERRADQGQGRVRRLLAAELCRPGRHGGRLLRPDTAVPGEAPGPQPQFAVADDLPLLDERQKEQARETGAVAFDACGTHYVIEGGAGEILRGYV